MSGFPDVEAVLVAALESFGTVDTVTPSDLQEQLPFIRVVRSGGPDDHVSDYPVVDLDVFGATRAQAWDLAAEIRDHLRFAHAIREFDRVGTEVGPRELPWGDPGIRRIGATYRIVTRRT